MNIGTLTCIHPTFSPGVTVIVTLNKQKPWSVILKTALFYSAIVHLNLAAALPLTLIGSLSYCIALMVTLNNKMFKMP